MIRKSIIFALATLVVLLFHWSWVGVVATIAGLAVALNYVVDVFSYLVSTAQRSKEPEP